jgi:sterol desaturase/sphingolipid hydroxylase (fatty acid hydroxylase superfamily)
LHIIADGRRLGNRADPHSLQGRPETTMSLRQFVLSLSTLPLKLAFFGGWIGLLLLWERFLPAAPRPADMTLSQSTRVGGNVTLGAINAILWIMVTLTLSVIALGVSPERGFLEWRSGWSEGWVGLAVDILVLDLFAYFWHRAAHENETLWRFHEVHHRDEFLDVTTGLRFHFGETIFGSAVRAVLLIALGSPIEHVIIFDLAVMVMNWFSHSNIKLPAWFEKPLSFLVVTPGLHWIHHKTSKPESDQNYAVIFSFWDMFFGTRAERDRRIGMEVGLRHVGDVPLGRLLIAPFLRRD